jgi:hypothetical protein
MPQSLKKYFNKKYNYKTEEDLSDREIVDIIKKKVSGGNKNRDN